MAGDNLKANTGQLLKKELKVETMIETRKEGSSNQPDGRLQLNSRGEKNHGATLDGNTVVGGLNGGLAVGQKGVQNPNPPRSPNFVLTPVEAKTQEPPDGRENAMENELFVEAIENSSIGSVESDMEIVDETPRLNQ
jgi:hypothetical protein